MNLPLATKIVPYIIIESVIPKYVVLEPRIDKEFAEVIKKESTSTLIIHSHPKVSTNVSTGLKALAQNLDHKMMLMIGDFFY